jgi:hypothetical protein
MTAILITRTMVPAYGESLSLETELKMLTSMWRLLTSQKHAPSSLFAVRGDLIMKQRTAIETAGLLH